MVDFSINEHDQKVIDETKRMKEVIDTKYKRYFDINE